MWVPSQQSHANTSPGGWTWASAWPLCSGWPGPGLAGGEGGPGRELLSAVNKQQKTELPGFFFWWGVAYWGKWGACLFLAGGSSHQQDHILGLSTGTSVVPAQLPSRWPVPVPPQHAQVSPIPEDHPHSEPQSVQLLFQSRSNQIYVQSKNSVEKVSKKAHSPSGVRMEVGLASVVPGTQTGWALSWQ